VSMEAASGPRIQTLATPRRVVRRIEQAIGSEFELDVCAEGHTAKASRWFTADDDGLSLDWAGLNWCNPPYDSIAAWVDKALYERRRRASQTVLLVPARVGMGWFLRCRRVEREGLATIAFWPGRIAFEGSGSAPYEYSAVIGIGSTLEGLRSLERERQQDLFGGTP
jgi:phage N-6-adenine-methyltransferase